MNRRLAAFTALSFATACASAPPAFQLLSRSPTAERPLRGSHGQHDPLGSGLTTDGSMHYSKPCLTSTDEQRSGAADDFQAIDLARPGDVKLSRRMRWLIAGGRRTVKRVNGSDAPPPALELLVRVRSKSRRHLTNFVWLDATRRLLKRGNISGFIETCGERVVEAVDSEAESLTYIALLALTPEDLAVVRTALAGHSQRTPSDSALVGVLDRLAHLPRVVKVSSDAAVGVPPPAFFGRAPWVESYLAEITGELRQSAGSVHTDLRQVPWRAHLTNMAMEGVPQPSSSDFVRAEIGNRLVRARRRQVELSVAAQALSTPGRNPAPGCLKALAQTALPAHQAAARLCAEGLAFGSLPPAECEHVLARLQTLEDSADCAAVDALSERWRRSSQPIQVAPINRPGQPAPRLQLGQWVARNGTPVAKHCAPAVGSANDRGPVPWPVLRSGIEAKVDERVEETVWEWSERTEPGWSFWRRLRNRGQTPPPRGTFSVLSWRTLRRAAIDPDGLRSARSDGIRASECGSYVVAAVRTRRGFDLWFDGSGEVVRFEGLGLADSPALRRLRAKPGAAAAVLTDERLRAKLLIDGRTAEPLVYYAEPALRSRRNTAP